MFASRFRTAGLAIAAALGLAACTDGYGYSGVSVGYGSAGYYDDGYYGGYGPASYFGWYGDYYYPGTGYYVYDRNRRAVRWNGAQQRYWQARQRAYRGDRRQIRQNWAQFGRDRRSGERVYPGGGRPDGRVVRGRDANRSEEGRAGRSREVSRPTPRAERRQNRPTSREQQYRQDRGNTERGTRGDRRPR